MNRRASVSRTRKGRNPATGNLPYPSFTWAYFNPNPVSGPSCYRKTMRLLSLSCASRKFLPLALAMAVSGCGSQPIASLQTVPAATRTVTAPVVTRHAAVPSPPAVVAAQQGSVAAPGLARTSTPAAALPEEPRTTLFAERYDPRARYAATDAEEAALEREVTANAEAAAPVVGPVARSWGLIGGALAGTALFGYAAYAGVIGSRDLLTPKDRSTFEQSPAAFGWAFDDVRFKGHDGTDLVGWYIPASRPTRQAILLLHGHTSNKDRALARYGEWLHDNYNVFLYDSRFHGKSGGKLTTLGWHERRDAAIALDRVKALGNTQVGVMGESMGGAVAIGLAADRPEIAGVWSDCAFSSLHDAVAPRAKLRGYPMPDYVAWSVVRASNLRARQNLPVADPIRVVSKLAPRPVYLVHGEADDETTPINSQKLYDKAQSPRTLWMVPGARHARSVEIAPVEYRSRLQAFWRQTLIGP